MSRGSSARPDGHRNYLLAHGSWHGGWCWARVADRLRARGHRVFTPSYSGMGDRSHLLSKDITLETFIEDVLQVIRCEELTDVTLVGHSFGGVVITGVADRMPQHLRHLVYLDAVLLESGRSAFSMYPPQEAQARIAAANSANGGVAVPIPAVLPPSWGLAEGSADHAWVARRMTPTPLHAYTTALQLRSPVGNGIPKTYVHCNEPENSVLDGSRALVKSMDGWRWIEFAGPHHCIITHVDEVVELLLEI